MTRPEPRSRRGSKHADGAARIVTRAVLIASPMVSEGDDAPDFTVPLADGDVGPFTLSEHLDEAPVVLAFVPGAFTPACTTELNAFQNELASFREAGATVYAVSVDTPFALNEWREQEGFEFDLVSDTNKEVIDAYGVSMDFADMGYHGVAERSVFVVDGDGTVTYRWVADDPSTQPDVEAVREAAAEAADAAD